MGNRTAEQCFLSFLERKRASRVQRSYERSELEKAGRLHSPPPCYTLRNTMSFLVEIITGFLTLYLAFTNGLADRIETYLATSEVEDTNYSETAALDNESFTQIPSQYKAIPDILIQNAAYQSASLIDGTGQTTPPSAPLDALVNIYCTYKTNDYIRATTGTGFFIHEDGIILTNAHVAQTLLLANIIGDSTCIIRTGNPASPTYTAELLYMSPAWLREYASIVNEEHPKGTGERDYALLYVNSGLNNRPMPNKFPYLAFDTELMRTSAQNTNVSVTGYPAQALIDTGIDANIVPKQATATITELMTFGSNYADIFSIGGTVVGEQGSSGGPVTNSAGEVIGMVVTRGDDALFGTGSLRALTLSYINRTMIEETGFPLWHNLSGNLPFRAQLYRETMVPFLEQLLKWEIE